MSFIFRKFKMVLLLLLVAAYSYGQARDAKNFIITPQTALRRPALKAFWTFDALCEVYAR